MSSEQTENSFTTMLTCQLSSRASKMLYSPRGAVNIASHMELLNQSDCWKLFVQL